jgi:hypothetical protein
VGEDFMDFGFFIFSSLFAIFTIVFFALGIYVMQHTGNERIQAKAELKKIVQQAGGQNIHVKDSTRLGTKGSVCFTISYIDINGEHQTRQASKKVDIWSLVGDFYWDKPIQMSEPSVEEARLDSKEQIIGDMDAEINRLQEELDRAKKET